jgi:hypothetical protein
MGIVSVDRAGESLAVKLSENAKVDPDKLLELVAESEDRSFSPSGILRIGIDREPIKTAIDVLRAIGK